MIARNACTALLGLLALTGGPRPCEAFKLQLLGPEHAAGVRERQARAFIEHYMEGVHEEITRKAYLKAGIKEMPLAILDGVRWNDNPPAIPKSIYYLGCNGRQIRLAENVPCWISIMGLDSLGWRSFNLKHNSIAPARSHFGDMQFLHAMATGETESRTMTLDNILQWAEFSYLIATGRIAADENVFGLAGKKTALSPTTARWISRLYSSDTKRKFSVRDIFQPIGSNLRLMAFGSLLHVVEDSYAPGHVHRDSTRIVGSCRSYDADSAVLQFLTYPEQDAEKHGQCDDAPDWLTQRWDDPSNPLAVLAELILLFETDDDGSKWGNVRELLLKRVFAFTGRETFGGPGECFESEASRSGDHPARDSTLFIPPTCP